MNLWDYCGNGYCSESETGDTCADDCFVASSPSDDQSGADYVLDFVSLWDGIDGEIGSEESIESAETAVTMGSSFMGEDEPQQSRSGFGDLQPGMPCEFKDAAIKTDEIYIKQLEGQKKIAEKAKQALTYGGVLGAILNAVNPGVPLLIERLSAVIAKADTLLQKFRDDINALRGMPCSSPYPYPAG